jgi:hypothetical protein
MTKRPECQRNDIQHSRSINAVAIQIKGQTPPGFAEVLCPCKCAVHSAAAQSTRGFWRNLMPRLSCSVQVNPQVLRQYIMLGHTKYHVYRT